MATKTVRVSDMSGEEIPDGAGWEIKIVPADGRRQAFVLDVTDDEAKALTVKARPVARRGRRPKVTA